MAAGEREELSPGIPVFWMMVECDNDVNGWTTGYSSQVYTEPFPDSEHLYTVRDDEAYRIISYSEYMHPVGTMNEYWYKVRLDDTEGWIYGGYLWNEFTVYYYNLYYEKE